MFRAKRLLFALSLLATFTALGCNYVRTAEVEMLAQALEVGPGIVVADIGAGTGGYSLALAERLGPTGRVYATEIDADSLRGLKALARTAPNNNITVVAVSDASTGLQRESCDAIFMRHSYHHLTQPEATLKSVYRSLKPGGLFVVIDFRPAFLLSTTTPEGIPDNRGGHGITPELVAREAVVAGFVVVKTISDWPGPPVLSSFAVVLQKSADSP